MAGLESADLGTCHILRRIGRGGMGEVYLAEQPALGRRVAVKVLPVERPGGAAAGGQDGRDGAGGRFAREARAVAALEHPHILPLYDVGEQDGLHYLVMPYVPDGSLADLLGRGASRGMQLPVAPTLAADLVRQAAEALQFAHDHNIVHLDVKPQNLLVRTWSTGTQQMGAAAHGGEAGATGTPGHLDILLADFGLARHMTWTTGHSGVMGTPLYTSPEQYLAHPEPASDQYALAGVAFLLLTGKPVFGGGLVELYHQHLSVPAPRATSVNPSLPVAVDDVLARALAKDPRQRFGSIWEFAQALAGAVSGPAPACPARSALVAKSGDAGSTAPDDASRTVLVAPDAYPADPPAQLIATTELRPPHAALPRLTPSGTQIADRSRLPAAPPAPLAAETKKHMLSLWDARRGPAFAAIAALVILSVVGVALAVTATGSGGYATGTGTATGRTVTHTTTATVATGADRGGSTDNNGASTSSGGTTASQQPTPALVSIEVTPSSATVAQGQTLQFTATGHFSDDSSQDITRSAAWNSTDNAVATMDNSGVATGVQTGSSVTITASEGGITSNGASLSVAAQPPPQVTLVSVAVSAPSDSIVQGDDEQLTAMGTASDGTPSDVTNSVLWSASDGSVAVVDNTGIVTGIAPGRVSITATGANGVSGRFTLTVKRPAKSP